MIGPGYLVERTTSDEDLDRVAALEAECFTNPWTRVMLEREIKGSATARVYVLRLHDRGVDGLGDLGREGAVLLRDIRHQPFMLELGEPQVLGEAVVQLARETCPLLERGALGFRETQPIERGVGTAQRAQI